MQCWIAIVPVAKGETARPPVCFTYEADHRSKKLAAIDDLLIICTKERMLGIARIEGVTSEDHERRVLKCPECKYTKIWRTRRTPPYHCSHGHQFAEPIDDLQTVVRHTLSFPHKFSQIVAMISPAELRPFEASKNPRVKLKQANLTGVCAFLIRRDRHIKPTLANWLVTQMVEIQDHEGDSIAPVPLAVADELNRPVHAILARRGLNSFRAKLIARHGAQCMITGSTVMALLEACQISKAEGAHAFHPANGLLLRSDLHTLYDLDLIAVSPTNLRIEIHSDLVGTEYSQFVGKRLLISSEKKLDLRWISARWVQFQRKLAQGARIVAFFTLSLDGLMP